MKRSSLYREWRRRQNKSRHFIRDKIPRRARRSGSLKSFVQIEAGVPCSRNWPYEMGSERNTATCLRHQDCSSSRPFGWIGLKSPMFDLERIQIPRQRAVMRPYPWHSIHILHYWELLMQDDSKWVTLWHKMSHHASFVTKNWVYVKQIIQIVENKLFNWISRRNKYFSLKWTKE